MFKRELKKKLLVVLGTTLMACSLIACGSDKSSDTTAATTKEAAKETTAEEKTEEAKKEDTKEEKKEEATTEKKKEETTEKKEETTEKKKEETTEKKEETTEESNTEAGPTEGAAVEIDPESSGRAAMNFIGNYTCGKATAEVSVTDGRVQVKIRNPYDAATVYEWTMSGLMNPDTLTVDFDNCTKSVLNLDTESGEPEEVDGYTSGTGMLSFADTDENDPTFMWFDEKENAGGGMEFIYTR